MSGYFFKCVLTRTSVEALGKTEKKLHEDRQRNESKGRLFMQHRAFMKWLGVKGQAPLLLQPLVYSCEGSIDVHKRTSISGFVGADG